MPTYSASFGTILERLLHLLLSNIWMSGLLLLLLDLSEQKQNRKSGNQKSYWRKERVFFLSSFDRWSDWSSQCTVLCGCVRGARGWGAEQTSHHKGSFFWRARTGQPGGPLAGPQLTVAYRWQDSVNSSTQKEDALQAIWPCRIWTSTYIFHISNTDYIMQKTFFERTGASLRMTVIIHVLPTADYLDQVCLAKWVQGKTNREPRSAASLVLDLAHGAALHLHLRWTQPQRCHPHIWWYWWVVGWVSWHAVKGLQGVQ